MKEKDREEIREHLYKAYVEVSKAQDIEWKYSRPNGPIDYRLGKIYKGWEAKQIEISNRLCYLGHYIQILRDDLKNK